MPIETIHMHEPAYSLIEKLGGKTAVAGELGVDKSTLSRWCQPKPYGTGGAVPQRHWHKLISLAKRKGMPLGWEELVALEV